MNKETIQSWEIFNAAYQETGVVRDSMIETGRTLLHQGHVDERSALFAKLDAQNQLIDTALRLKNVRAQIKAESTR